MTRQSGRQIEYGGHAGKEFVAVVRGDLNFHIGLKVNLSVEWFLSVTWNGPNGAKRAREVACSADTERLSEMTSFMTWLYASQTTNTPARSKSAPRTIFAID